MEHYFTNNESLKSELRTLKYDYGSVSFTFQSDNGVFSKDKVDYGSRFLVETFIKNKKSSITSLLDVGCGYGYIGVVLGNILNISVDMVDVNKRAVHLAELNVKNNKVNASVYESDIYSNVLKKFDIVITNPPIRAGKKVVLGFLVDAIDKLNPDGELWFVMRKDQGVKSINKVLENTYNLDIIEKSKGFYVIKAKKR
ncbi:MAG: methyltransferase [Erysipelotrichaceae bacterium]